MLYSGMSNQVTTITPESILKAKQDHAEQWAKLSKPNRHNKLASMIGDASQDNYAIAWEITKAYVLTKSAKKLSISDSTLKAYRVDLKRLIDFIQGDLTGMTDDTASRYVNELLSDGLKPQTIKKKLSAASNFYKALVWCGLKSLPDENIFENEKLEAPKPVQKHLGVNEVESTLEALENYPKQMCVYLLGIDAGLRGQEICDLKHSDIDIANSVIHIKSGKGNKDRIAPLTKRLYKCLLKMQAFKHGDNVVMFLDRKTKEPSKYTPDSLRMMLFRFCQTQFGMGEDGKPIHYKALHSLRRYFATSNRDKGARVDQLQSALGHSDPRTTLGYFEVNALENAQALANL